MAQLFEKWTPVRRLICVHIRTAGLCTCYYTPIHVTGQPGRSGVFSQWQLYLSDLSALTAEQIRGSNPGWCCKDRQASYIVAIHTFSQAACTLPFDSIDAAARACMLELLLCHMYE